MQLTAKLIQVLPLQTGVGRNGEWKKQDIVVETDGQYPKKICISIWGDKANESVLQVGNVLDISFDVESREYNGRWYTDVKAWKVDLASPAAAIPPVPDFAQAPIPPSPPVDFGADSADDLPF
ncbi:hypothetical protein M2132_002038 [Dysgonomonas sp. PH5-45]|uniref:DUF3127 domain-containing protein n=1 Tax=unclassified Dysgonomonas TaxID=2630389 RepID=UPI002473BF4B|nr:MULTISPECIES: DUF3127 domain-containing protein [unclassified Dysgonomonas]MDH6355692.1 hypothetical protein [Dysgonomonas sp. PH5-45]MDH6388589.1 hypothetical protein [Dysgonomonas sp. PH5-37]